MYSTPTCSTCSVAEKRLEREGIPFRKVDVSEDPSAAERLKADGKTQVPVFEFDGELHTIVGLAGIIKHVKERSEQ